MSQTDNQWSKNNFFILPSLSMFVKKFELVANISKFEDFTLKM